MQFTIEVNNRKIFADKGETILSALNRNGILIPTLCRMKEFTPTGACRMCVVEVEGRDRLVTACSQPVEEWMKIRTHSPRVIRARKTIVELLLSNHPDDCLYCDRNLNCELQKLAEELNITERRIKGRKVKLRLDQSSPAIVRELSKCILCGRCVRVCEEMVTATTLDFLNRGRKTQIGTAMNRDFNFSSCINCGQCVLVCPTGALHEKHNIAEVMENLSKPELTRVIQYSPAVPFALADSLGLKYTRDFDRIINSVLRKIGFELIYNTGFATDLYIHEMAGSVIENHAGDAPKPIYVSACPAWVKYAEQFTPGLIDSISPLKSPQQIAGSLIKSFIPERKGINADNIFSVSVTPCIAMKFEARRDGMTRKGVSDVDAVLTVMELARLVRLFGIDITSSAEEAADDPMGMRSASALLTEVSGGYTEAVVRSLLFMKNVNTNDRALFRKVRSGSGFREVSVSAAGEEYNFAVVDGLTALQKLNNQIAAGKRYDMIEIMVCPGGCVNGGGLSFSSTREIIRNRAKFIYQTEEAEAVSVASKSPALLSFYEDLGKSGEELSGKSLFHTRYIRRDVLL
ncbi:MAG: (2Fe-2S)-binding protein [Bacteroidales bacterium]|nr:(2Fe-2S)-binding protein [Bacteroidales bacterium]